MKNPWSKISIINSKRYNFSPLICYCLNFKQATKIQQAIFHCYKNSLKNDWKTATTNVKTFIYHKLVSSWFRSENPCLIRPNPINNFKKRNKKIISSFLDLFILQSHTIKYISIPFSSIQFIQQNNSQTTTSEPFSQPSQFDF